MIPIHMFSTYTCMARSLGVLLMPGCIGCAVCAEALLCTAHVLCALMFCLCTARVL